MLKNLSKQRNDLFATIKIMLIYALGMEMNLNCVKFKKTMYQKFAYQE